MQDFLLVCYRLILLVSGGSQGQDYGVCYLQHGLQDGSNHNEEDDGEEEGSVNDLKLDEASLDSKDQQGDAFRHAPVWTYRKQTCDAINTIITHCLKACTPTHKHTSRQTCAWCCHSWRLCNLEGKTCRVWELPERWRRPWKPDPVMSTVYYSTLQYWGQGAKRSIWQEERGRWEERIINR